MLARLGFVFHWIANVVAVVIALFGLAIQIMSNKTDMWIPAVAVLVIAGLVWLVGRAVLWILAGE